MLRNQLDLADRNGRTARQGRGEGDGLRQQPIGRDQPIDDPEAGRGLRVKRLARQQQFHRLLPADQARQALRPAVAGQEAERDFRDAEAVFALRGKAEIGRERDLQATAQAMTTDGGDEHFRRVLHLEQDFVHVQDRHRPRLGGDAAEHPDVGPGAEELGQVRHQHRRADRFIEPDLIDGGIQVVDELPVVRIRRRAIEVDERHAPLLLADRDNPGRGGRLLHRSLLCVP